MSMSLKRRATAGFTLIELLIVVIILAIISAIAIPQFSAATSDAQESALDANLATIRNSLEQYRAQHTRNVYPGTNASSGGTGCDGVAGTGGANTLVAMQQQLQFASNALGQTCSIANAIYRYGPYLRQGIPNEPINNVAAIAFTSTGAPIVAGTANGWAYDSASGQFIMNSTAEVNGRAYSAR